MNKKRKHITFGKPFVGKEELDILSKVIKSKWIGTGPITQNFEEKFKKYKESKYAISVNSCTAAIHLSLITLGIKKGDEVITTPMTFASTINAIVLVGAKPILADINEKTFNIDPKNIEKKITKKTKAILIVHLAGLPCEVNKIKKIAKKNRLYLIEDCAHSIESKYNNRHTGTLGDMGCFSFYSTKNLTTAEGGMILCKKIKQSDRLKVLRLHGLARDAWQRYLPKKSENITKFNHYDVKEIGFKYNLTDLNSALGLAQLKKIDRNWLERKKIYQIYKKKLSDLPLDFQNFTTDVSKFKHAYHLCIIRLKKENIRDQLAIYLQKNNIGFGITYRSVTDMSVFRKKFKWNDKTCVNSKNLGDNLISLPIYPGLTKSEQFYICKKLNDFFLKL
jgi:dTDP-4-amino-4,6-dideoxygalactose transaminase